MSRRVRQLLILLPVLAFTVLGSFAPALAFDCSQFNTALCIYHWEPELGCCVPSTSNRLCVWQCF